MVFIDTKNINIKMSHSFFHSFPHSFSFRDLLPKTFGKQKTKLNNSNKRPVATSTLTFFLSELLSKENCTLEVLLVLGMSMINESKRINACFKFGQMLNQKSNLVSSKENYVGT